MPIGSLTVVGTGIQYAAHTTPAAQAVLRRADKVFYVVDNPAAAAWLHTLNPSAESLRFDPGADDMLRPAMYDAMAERMVASVRKGQNVCAAFYGHPGIFVCPTHTAVQLARREGFQARILPGISAADCLFADLEIDPAQNGLLSFDATDFLIYGRKPDPACHLLLWQIGLVGDPYYQSFATGGLSILIEVLGRYYEADHQVVVYEAAINPGDDPVVQRVALAEVGAANVTPISLLYIPPQTPSTTDVEILLRLMRQRKRVH